ncbi:unnamed protein product, partial [Owenia fusiformis]
MEGYEEGEISNFTGENLASDVAAVARLGSGLSNFVVNDVNLQSTVTSTDNIRNIIQEEVNKRLEESFRNSQTGKNGPPLTTFHVASGVSRGASASHSPSYTRKRSRSPQRRPSPQRSRQDDRYFRSRSSDYHFGSSRSPPYKSQSLHFRSSSGRSRSPYGRSRSPVQSEYHSISHRSGHSIPHRSGHSIPHLSGQSVQHSTVKSSTGSMNSSRMRTVNTANESVLSLDKLNNSKDSDDDKQDDKRSSQSETVSLVRQLLDSTISALEGEVSKDSKRETLSMVALQHKQDKKEVNSLPCPPIF